MAVRKRIGDNGRLLVVLDACHSGGAVEMNAMMKILSEAVETVSICRL